jgi:hypothetical protein
MENDIPRKWNLKHSGVAILISDKGDFKTKLVRRDEVGYHILIRKKINLSREFKNFKCIYTDQWGAQFLCNRHNWT